jgi:hypothetical protein
MKFENTKVFNVVRAVYSARNALNSWAKSDSDFDTETLGANDLALAQRLIKAGSEHRKFMRQIFVTVDITAPIYFIQELDTYKVGTTRNSCSFMHRGTAEPFTIDNFEVEQPMKEIWADVIDALNSLREEYLRTKDVKIFTALRQLLPMGYLCRFTWTASYENIYSMIRQRKQHRLKEWNTNFIEWTKTLPYSKELLYVER